MAKLALNLGWRDKAVSLDSSETLPAICGQNLRHRPFRSRFGCMSYAPASFVVIARQAAQSKPHAISGGSQTGPLDACSFAQPAPAILCTIAHATRASAQRGVSGITDNSSRSRKNSGTREGLALAGIRRRAQVHSYAAAFLLSPGLCRMATLYRAAILEKDWRFVAERISIAEEAIVARTRELFHQIGSEAEMERDALDDACTLYKRLGQQRGAPLRHDSTRVAVISDERSSPASLDPR